jgi:probable selenium-dependent hydroxylase accessory protein YqeC
MRFDGSHSSLLECFRIDESLRAISLVGGGGKTTLMYALAAEIATSGASVITTTTTKIFAPAPVQSPCLILLKDDPNLKGLDSALKRFRHVTIADSLLPVGKLEHPPGTVIESLIHRADTTIIEADGAAGRPIKAPEEWEPVIPDFTDLVIPVVGLDCLGRPATPELVFRFERFLAVTGLRERDAITPRAVAKLLNHRLGALKNVPDKALVVPYFNKLDVLRKRMDINGAIEEIFETATTRIQRIVVGALGRDRRVTAYDRIPASG